MIIDSEARTRATDPKRSFIVQAPAGSGKTELLTQRFLRLLAGVQYPEQIIALTFTRKAAAEMRQRIVDALERASKDEVLESAHQQQTQALAKKALERDKKEEWQLLSQPSRLRIMTIDALCQMIVKAIPLKDKQCPFATVSDKPESLYRKAAFQFFEQAINDPQLEEPISLLLDHLDNRQDKLRQFMENLLSTREQWLRPLFTLHQQTKADFEAALSAIETHEIERFIQILPSPIKEDLRSLSQQVASIENDPLSPRYPLSQWSVFDNLDRDLIAALAALLLTKNDELRKSVDHHVGFKKEKCAKLLYQAVKEKSQVLFETLASYPDFIKRLIHLKQCPPAHYEDSQWEILQALLTLLPHLLAHLQVLFNETNSVDFSAILEQALVALGDADAPTDLALYLDYTIHHLLIDEFQDTSINQYSLLEKLVQGWLPDEGKTLFIVGDPMQSIYRFRQAEVGLFLKARLQGLGPVSLEALALSSNFRSTENLVHWVNFQFQSIFPKQEDMETGAIAYHKAEAVLKSVAQSTIKATQLTDKEEEALSLVACIEETLNQFPDDDIAVLVRSRKQLQHLIPLLRARQIAFQGVEIEQLANLPHLKDMWTLTKALTLPANRLYWLALLRSPWAGLSLADLDSLANWNNDLPLLEALAHREAIATLSLEGQHRASFIYQVLNQALEKRHQLPLIDWLINTSTALYSDKILTESEQRDLAQFWTLLEQFLTAEGLPDIEPFEKAFKGLYSKNSSPAKLQIMTIHKSKGLEFDTVILPGLGKKSKQTDYPLIRWLKLPKENQNPLFLLSPIRAAHASDCPVYDYLSAVDAEKDDYELQRLLYVACTRAKKRLYLFDNQDKETAHSFRSLLKNQPFQSAKTTKDSSANASLPELKRLPFHFYQSPPLLNQETSNPHQLIPIANIARQIGIITHELLQWICASHSTDFFELPWHLVQNRLQQLGFLPEEKLSLTNQIKKQIDDFLKNPKGQWLSSKHDEEQNEYELLIVEEGNIHTRIVDRTFVEAGRRWIIDFKTGQEDEASLAKHRQQVNGYAAAFKKLSPYPISCGLYYLSSGSFIQWAYEFEADLAPLLVD